MHTSYDYLINLVINCKLKYYKFLIFYTKIKITKNLKFSISNFSKQAKLKKHKSYLFSN